MPSIVIDAGHGGAEVRGRSTPGFGEKEVVLAIARAANRRLGSRALLTRDRDVNLSLGERIGVARDARAKAFVSVHASPSTSSDEIFVHTRASERSLALARSLSRALGGRARISRAELAVLSPEHHRRETAACLIEVCDPRAIDRYGRGIAEALKVIGTNDMQLVADPMAVPYRYIARLTIGMESAQGQGHISGSGTLIAPNIILTTGHNLRREMDPIGRPSAVTDQIQIWIAGKGPLDATGWWAHDRWLNAANDHDQAEYDYGLIQLKTDLSNLKMPDGDSLLSWSTGRGTAFDRVDPAKVTTVHVAGFPSVDCVADVGTRDGTNLTYPALMESTGAARPFTTADRIIGYDADTCPEQSGGPVWIDDDGTLTFVGVHHGSWMFPDHVELNNCTRLTREMLDTIDKVINGKQWVTDVW
jgi:V8-like Glu-specific endopeptidase